jgi:hypothetical protein
MISRLRVVLTQQRFGNLSNGLKTMKNEMNKLKQHHDEMFANWVKNVEFHWIIQFALIWTSISSGYFCSCWIRDRIMTITDAMSEWDASGGIMTAHFWRSVNDETSKQESNFKGNSGVRLISG